MLFDDIATVLDDVAVLTKLAAKKTAGVLGDDLALNAQQLSGVRAERELPVIWSVFKGSAINKLILVPAALAISAIAPWLVVYLLMIGGLYLCFEGVEKVLHSFFHKSEQKQHKENLREVLVNPEADFADVEKQQVKGAIRTDFILSAEIIVIALGAVSDAPFMNQVLVVCLIAAGITFGVYGLVALIVKLDDIAIFLSSDLSEGGFAKLKRFSGRALLRFCPWFMKALSIVGTAAMFLVGGGILVHGIPFLHHLQEDSAFLSGSVGGVLYTFVIGFVAGLILVGLFTLWNKIRGKEHA